MNNRHTAYESLKSDFDAYALSKDDQDRERTLINLIGSYSKYLLSNKDHNKRSFIECFDKGKVLEQISAKLRLLATDNGSSAYQLLSVMNIDNRRLEQLVINQRSSHFFLKVNTTSVHDGGLFFLNKSPFKSGDTANQLQYEGDIEIHHSAPFVGEISMPALTGLLSFIETQVLQGSIIHRLTIENRLSATLFIYHCLSKALALSEAKFDNVIKRLLEHHSKASSDGSKVVSMEEKYQKLIQEKKRRQSFLTHTIEEFEKPDFANETKELEKLFNYALKSTKNLNDISRDVVNLICIIGYYFQLSNDVIAHTLFDSSKTIVRSHIVVNYKA